jgi:hypothetical protein
LLKKIQTTITNTKTTRPHNDAKQQELRQSLVNWLIDDLIPLKIVQSEKFRNSYKI